MRYCHAPLALLLSLLAFHLPSNYGIPMKRSNSAPSLLSGPAPPARKTYYQAPPAHKTYDQASPLPLEVLIDRRIVEVTDQQESETQKAIMTKDTILLPSLPALGYKVSEAKGGPLAVLQSQPEGAKFFLLNSFRLLRRDGQQVVMDTKGQPTAGTLAFPMAKLSCKASSGTVQCTFKDSSQLRLQGTMEATKSGSGVILTGFIGWGGIDVLKKALTCTVTSILKDGVPSITVHIMRSVSGTAKVEAQYQQTLIQTVDELSTFDGVSFFLDPAKDGSNYMKLVPSMALPSIPKEWQNRLAAFAWMAAMGALKLHDMIG